MMYLIHNGVKKDCEDYDAIWEELKKRMFAVSKPIVPVDWALYDDDGKLRNYGLVDTIVDFLKSSPWLQLFTAQFKIFGCRNIINITRN